MSADIEHDDQDHEHAPNWWRVLDVAVWVAVILLVVLGTEWLVGLLIRERLAAGFARLTKAASRPAATE